MAELATDHLDERLGKHHIDGVASRRPACSPSGPQTADAGLVGPNDGSVSEAVLVFAGIAVAFTDKAVAAAGDAGTEPCAYVGADFGLCAGTGVGGIALGLDADSEHGAAAFLVSYEGVVSGFAPQALRTIVLVIHVTASRYTNKPIAGEADVALVLTRAGPSAGMPVRHSDPEALSEEAVDITGARGLAVSILTTAATRSAGQLESTHST